MSAQSLYWDTNGATAGAGNPANGTWNAVDANWSTSSLGDIATTAYTAGSDVFFSAGTDALTAAITLGSGVSANSLTFQEGTVTITGNQTITLGVGGITVDSGSGVISIGNEASSAKITASTAQTWTNNSTQKLIVGGGALNGLVTVVGPGAVQFGNDATSSNFSGAGGIQIGSYDGGTESYTSGQAVLRMASGGLGTGNVYLVSGTITGPSNNRIKGLQHGSVILQGDFTINAGTDGSAAATQELRLEGDHVLTLGANATSAFPFSTASVTETIAGTSLTLAGTGFLAVTGTTSTYGGGTILRGGNLRIAGDGSLGAVPGVASTNISFEENSILSAGAANVVVGATRDIAITTGKTATFDSNGNALTVNGVISGDGAVTKTGIGIVSLNALNSYSGVTSVSSGTLAVNTLANGGSVSGVGQSSNSASNLLLANGTTLKYNGGAASSDRLFTLNATGGNQGATIEASGSGALNLTNTGSIAYGNNNQTRTLTLTGTNTGANTLSATINNNGSGATSLVKNGEGTWVLAGNNAYTGATTVNAGTLLITGSQGSSSVSIVAGTLGGAGDGVSTGIIGGATTLSAGAKLSPGSGAGLAGNLTFSNGLNLSASSNDTGAYLFNLNAVGSSDRITLTTGTANALNIGTLDAADFTFTTGVGFGAGVYVLFDANSVIAGSIGTALVDFGGGITGTLSIDSINNDILLTVVPEPSTVLMLTGGLMAGALLRRRRS